MMEQEQDIFVRRTDMDDAEAIFEMIDNEEMIISERFGDRSVRQLIERSILSITAIDDSNNCVGFAVFDDSPPWVENIDPGRWEEYVKETFELEISVFHTMWLQFFVADHLVEQDVAHAILSTAFNTLPETEHILMLLPSTTPAFKPLCSFDGNTEQDLFTPIQSASKKKHRAYRLYQCPRQRVIPVMNVREALVEDYDDLVPIFHQQSTELFDRYGEFGLADIISSTDETKATLVAEVDSKAIGILGLSTNVDYQVLGKCFELEPFDYLMIPEDQAPPPGLSSETGADKNGDGGYNDASDGPDSTGQSLSVKQNLRAQGMQSTSLSQMLSEDNSNKSGSGNLLKTASTNSRTNSVHSRKMSSIKEGSSLDEYAQDVTRAEYEEDEDEEIKGTPNAFAVTLFCIDEAYEARAFQFLEAGFANFPDREYCILMVPHHASEFPLLSHFQQVRNHPGSKFPSALYIFHKYSLMLFHGLMGVRPTVEADMDAIGSQTRYLEDGSHFKNDILHALDYPDDNKHAISITLDEVVIGAMVVESNIDHESIRQNFNIETFINWDFHEPTGHLILRHFVISPVFNKTVKYLLKEVMRKMHGSCIYYQVEPTTVAIPALVEFLPVAPRRNIQHPGEVDSTANEGFRAGLQKPKISIRDSTESIDSEGSSGGGGGGVRFGVTGEDSTSPASSPGKKKSGISFSTEPSLETTSSTGSKSSSHSHPLKSALKSHKETHYALYALSRKSLTEQKINVNHRLVIVGASDCALSLIESLVFVHYLNFSHITLISEGGLPTFEEEFMMHNYAYTRKYWQRLSLRSKVRVIDAPMIGIDRDKNRVIVKGDLSIPYDELVLCCGLQEQTPNKLLGPPPHVGGIYPLDLESHVDAMKTYLFRHNVLNDPRPVFVYGNSIEAYCAIQGLIDNGVRDIVQIIPSKDDINDAQSSSSKSSNGNGNGSGAYDNINNAPQNLLPEAIQDYVDEAMRLAGVTVHRDLSLVGIEEEHFQLVAVLFEATTEEAKQKFSNQASQKRDYMDTDMFSNRSDEIRMPCKVLLMHDVCNIDPRTFNAINDACLVYDGRLVINQEFKTNDPKILAAGTLTKFSKRTRSVKFLQEYSSKEVGRTVASCIMRHVDPLSMDMPAPRTIPQFEEPKSVGGLLPGGYYFLRSYLPWKPESNGKGSGEDNERLLITNNPGHEYVCISVDRYNIIDEIVYLGTERPETDNLMSLIGLPERYLNNLIDRFDEGLINDLIPFLRGSWIQAVYHDRFIHFRQQLLEDLSSEVDVGSIQQSVLSMVESGKSISNSNIKTFSKALTQSTKELIKAKLIEFLDNNANILDMFYVPEEEEEEVQPQDGEGNQLFG